MPGPSCRKRLDGDTLEYQNQELGYKNGRDEDGGHPHVHAESGYILAQATVECKADIRQSQRAVVYMSWSAKRCLNILASLGGGMAQICKPLPKYASRCPNMQAVAQMCKPLPKSIILKHKTIVAIMNT